MTERMPTMREIAEDVSWRHGIPMQHLKGPRRMKAMVFARHEAMWIMLQEGRWSTTQIGGFFNRDHTTAIAAGRAHEARRTGGTLPWRMKAAARLSSASPQAGHLPLDGCGQVRLSQSPVAANKPTIPA